VTRLRGTALVTGGSSGIGRAIALRLAVDGYAVVSADVRREPLTGGAPTDELVRQAGGVGVHLPADVGRADDCRRIVDETVARCGSIDLLVNNARLAGRHSRPLLETEDDDWDAMMDVDLRGPFILCREAVRRMLDQPAVDGVRGRIVNITSQYGLVGAPGHFTYAVAKGGLTQMTRQIAVEHGRDGILCNAVAPGKIVTGSPDDTGDSDELARHTLLRTPFARLGRPTDVAAAVAFLASPEVSFISGATLSVDGGWMAS